MCPGLYRSMIGAKDHKYEIRLKMVFYARNEGIWAAARHFGCSRNTVRLWLRRFGQGGRSDLVDRSRAPHSSPHKTSRREEQRILEARRRVPCYGPARLKHHFGLKASLGAIGRVLRQAGLTRRRRKKHEKKRDLRAVKARYRPFERMQLDTKDLSDIAHYWPQMRALGLPTRLYSHRDVRSGGIFCAWGDELSQTYAELAARAIAKHLLDGGVSLEGSIWRTDNGSEYGGADRHERTRGFHASLDGLGGLEHRFNPPATPNANADAESFHELIEVEFFDLEGFRSLGDFLAKAATYQLYFNLARPLTTKDNKTPAQILEQYGLSPRLLRAPVIYLPALLSQTFNAQARTPPRESRVGQNLPVDTAT